MPTLELTASRQQWLRSAGLLNFSDPDNPVFKTELVATLTRKGLKYALGNHGAYGGRPPAEGFIQVLAEYLEAAGLDFAADNTGAAVSLFGRSSKRDIKVVKGRNKQSAVGELAKRHGYTTMGEIAAAGKATIGEQLTKQFGFYGTAALRSLSSLMAELDIPFK